MPTGPIFLFLKNVPGVAPTPIISNNLGGKQIPIRFVPNKLVTNSKTPPIDNSTSKTQNNHGTNQIPIRFVQNNVQVNSNTLPFGSPTSIRFVQSNVPGNSKSLPVGNPTSIRFVQSTVPGNSKSLPVSNPMSIRFVESNVQGNSKTLPVGSPTSIKFVQNSVQVNSKTLPVGNPTKNNFAPNQIPIRFVQNNPQVKPNTSSKTRPVVKPIIQDNPPPPLVPVNSPTAPQIVLISKPNPDNSQQPFLKLYAVQPRTSIVLEEPKKFGNNRPKQVIVTYKNPFDYSGMEKNMQKSDTERKLKFFEEKMNKAEKTTFMCKLCCQKITEINLLKDHYEWHKQISDAKDDDDVQTNQEHKVACPICGDSFISVYLYRNHIEKHRPLEFTCERCETSFSTEYNLSIHLADHSTDPETYVCVVCKTFSTESPKELHSHLNIEHSKKFFCQECRFDFGSETWFKNHEMFHFDKINFSCLECDILFPMQRQLVQHMSKEHKVDMNEIVKKFKCFECNLTFAKEKNLTNHNNSIHSHNAKSHLCSICGMGFSTHYSMKLHMEVHGERNYVCSYCGKKFKQNSILKTHMGIHTNKRYKCEICEKQFTQISSLTIHRRIHSGERPYPCEICGKGFITKTIRDAHRKKCH